MPAHAPVAWIVPELTDTTLRFARKTDQVAAEAVTDGLYVVRTSLPAEVLDDAATVRGYKSLALVERVFRCTKKMDLQERPVHHWLADRVRAHVVFACWPFISNVTCASA